MAFPAIIPPKTNGDNGNFEDKELDKQLFTHAMQLVSSSVLPMALNAAFELNLLEIMAKAGPGALLSPSAIAAQLPTQNSDAPVLLDRILRLLTAHCVVTCHVDKDFKRLYGLAPVCRYFVRNEDGVSLGPYMSLLQDKVFMDSWCKLKDAVLEGGNSFNKAHGASVFEYPSMDPRFNQVVNTAMYDHTTMIVKKMLMTYTGFEDLKRLVDVGGGLGVSLQIITSKYPYIHGINFDLPHIIKQAPIYPGVEHVGGDMFKNVPRGDAIFLKGILHDWNDELCLKLLNNCYRALPKHGKVIIVESVLPIYPECGDAARVKSQNDVLMMAQSSGGRERMQEELFNLAYGAGFASITLAKCIDNIYWVMEFKK